MGSNGFAPFIGKNGTFTVKNIANPPKAVKVFQYPIPPGQERNLLKIPGVGEADINVSLSKGELYNKLLSKEVTVMYSDINLVQFNADQRDFLREGGVNVGLTVDQAILAYVKKEDVRLIGDIDDVNTVFMIPSGKFVYEVDRNIIVYRNGIKQAFLDDFFIAESEGPGTGYDTVIMTLPPTTTPPPDDIITADYYIYNP